MLGLFPLLRRLLGARRGYNVGFALYWAGWCVAFPRWVVGAGIFGRLFRDGRPPSAFDLYRPTRYLAARMPQASVRMCGIDGGEDSAEDRPVQPAAPAARSGREAGSNVLRRTCPRTLFGMSRPRR
jgi:hypothetical protein